VPSLLARAGLLLAVVVLSVSVAACGKDKKKTAVKPSPLAITLNPAGKAAKFTVPATTKGGLVQVTFANTTAAPHAAQLVRIEGSHTTQEALKAVTSNSPKTPEWVRAEGGVGGTGPRSRGTALVDLPAGRYMVADVGGPGGPAPPAYAQFNVTAGTSGEPPAAASTIDAAENGKDKYEWKLSGAALKSGPNRITFKSGGKEALHLVALVKLKRDVSEAEVLKALKTNGPPPAFIDQNSFATTAVLDGDKVSTTDLNTTAGPGTYVLFCPLTDRDGGKPHFEEGLLKKVVVK
jgi:hypothetical protein